MAPRGHIRQRKNGSYEVIVPVGRDAKSGNYRYLSRSLPAPATYDDAMDLRDRLRAEAESGGQRIAKGTVAALLEDFYRTYRDDWSPHTQRNYRRSIDLYIGPRLGERPLRKLTTAHINDAYRDLRAAGGRRATEDGKPTGLSASSVARLHGMFHSALEHGKRTGLLTRNPADGAFPGRPTSKRRPSPTPEQARSLIAAAFGHSDEFGTYLLIIAATSRRAGEICGLRRCDVALDTGEISIMGTVVEGEHGVEYRGVTKSREDSTLALDPQSLVALKRHMLAMEKRALKVGARLTREAFVFSDDPRCLKPWWPHTQSRRFRAIRATLGLDHLVLHGMRHFGITYMLAGGVDLRTAQSRVGHTSMQVTERYAKFVTEADRAAAAKLGALLHGEAIEGG